MAEKIWVFAYGSLMWRPDFPYLKMRPARLFGYHRALCIYSIRARGTSEIPGLVLGLDRGGSCVGRAYAVAAENWEDVRAYLIDREMTTNVYTPTFLRLVLEGGERVNAYCFVARRDHVQYTGKLPDKRMVELLLQGIGQHGPATEYLANTVAHLDELGITAGPLHRILEKTERATPAGE